MQRNDKIFLGLYAVSALFVVAFIFTKAPKAVISTPAKTAKPAHIALIEAAQAHNIDPLFLLAISKIETAGTFSVSIRPTRKNGKFIGTARGLCQFIKSTAKAHGLDWSSKSAVDQARACARLLNDNKSILSNRLDRDATEGEIYLAHVFGAGRAFRIVTAKSNTSVVNTVGRKALKANRFLARYKNAKGIRAWAERKIKKAKFAVRVYLTPHIAQNGNPKLWVNAGN